MEKQPKPKSLLGKKRKRKLSATIAASEPKTIKVESPANETDVITIAPSNKKLRKKKVSISISEPAITNNEEIPEPAPKKKNTGVQETPLPVVTQGLSMQELATKYPILNNKELVERFLKVPFSNNQKGRIRQAIKNQLQGSDNTVSADIINGKIQAILKGTENLNDSDLRRLRILYNMLKATIAPGKEITVEKKKEKKKKKTKEGTQTDKEETQKDKDVTQKDKKDKKEQLVNKVKGPKRYVVFVGNLPLDVDKEKLMKHFAEIDEHIIDIRIPQQAEGKKSAIAFIEVNNEPTFEMALSKHHSMLENKRINVMYTTQQNSKVTKSEAKGKAAKLIALQKSGKLAGSTAVGKKRSHRRNILKKARAKEAEQT